MSLVVDVLSWILLLGGGALIITGAIGLLRFPDFFTRLHAVSVTETLATWSILLGLALQAGLTQTTIKLALIWIFLTLTGPTATHALAKAALHGKLRPMLAEEEDEHRHCD